MMNKKTEVKTNEVKAKVVNLTPHTINDAVSGKAFPPSGEVARATTEYTPVEGMGGDLAGVPLFNKEVGNVTGLPEFQEGVFYIVSGMVKEIMSVRHDLLAPGDLVRDENGKPIGCRGIVI